MIRLNLMAFEREPRRRGRRATLALLLSAAFIAAPPALHALLTRRIAEVEARSSRLVDELRDESTRSAEIQLASRQRRALAAQRDRIAGARARMRALTCGVSALSRALPAGVTVSELRGMARGWRVAGQADSSAAIAELAEQLRMARVVVGTIDALGSAHDRSAGGATRFTLDLASG